VIGLKAFMGFEIGDEALFKCCQPVPFCAILGERPMSAMSKEQPTSQKTQLALAIASGTSVAAWARDNEVPRRTAYRWCREPKVRAAIESIRRRAIDRAVGRLARRVAWATDGIAKLAKNAKSEAVKLTALRAIFSEMMAITEFAGLELRITEIEEQVHERAANKGYPG
jgi:hypothetical protein